MVQKIGLTAWERLQRCSHLVMILFTDVILETAGYIEAAPGNSEEDLQLVPSVSGYPIIEGDRYLICSDGITDMLSDGEIADIFTREISTEETVQVLVERALKKGGRDNITVIMCEIE